MNFSVDLNEVKDVKEFVRVANLYETNIVVSSQNKNFTVNGSSLMGLFSLDLSKPVDVYIENVEIGKSFKNNIKNFVV